MDTDYIYNMDIPRSCFRLGKQDNIKLVIPELINQAPGVVVCDIRPVYAVQAENEQLSLQALQTKKTSTFPWNASLTVKEPLANKIRLEEAVDDNGGFSSEETDEVVVNSTNNSDPEDFVVIESEE